MAEWPTPVGWRLAGCPDCGTVVQALDLSNGLELRCTHALGSSPIWMAPEAETQGWTPMVDVEVRRALRGSVPAGEEDEDSIRSQVARGQKGNDG